MESIRLLYQLKKKFYQFSVIFHKNFICIDVFREENI